MPPAVSYLSPSIEKQTTPDYSLIICNGFSWRVYEDNGLLLDTYANRQLGVPFSWEMYDPRCVINSGQLIKTPESKKVLQVHIYPDPNSTSDILLFYDVNETGILLIGCGVFPNLRIIEPYYGCAEETNIYFEQGGVMVGARDRIRHSELLHNLKNPESTSLCNEYPNCFDIDIFYRN